MIALEALPAGAPLSAQYVAALTQDLSLEVRMLPPTSARFRRELQAAAIRRGWPLRISRRELARSIAYLARATALTSHPVECGESC